MTHNGQQSMTMATCKKGERAGWILVCPTRSTSGLPQGREHIKQAPARSNRGVDRGPRPCRGVVNIPRWSAFASARTRAICSYFLDSFRGPVCDGPGLVRGFRTTEGSIELAFPPANQTFDCFELLEVSSLFETIGYSTLKGRESTRIEADQQALTVCRLQVRTQQPFQQRGSVCLDANPCVRLRVCGRKRLLRELHQNRWRTGGQRRQGLRDVELRVGVDVGHDAEDMAPQCSRHHPLHCGGIVPPLRCVTLRCVRVDNVPGDVGWMERQ